MRITRRASLGLALAVLVAGLTLPNPPGFASDTDLFTAAVPPNVVFIVDNSISMKHLVWHPAYDASVPNTDCTYYAKNQFVWFSSSIVTLDKCDVAGDLTRIR